MSVKHSDIHEKLADAYVNRDIAAMDEAINLTMEAGLADSYGAMLAAKFHLLNNMLSEDDLDLPSVEQERSFTKMVSYEDKLGLLKNAAANHRGFVCDRTQSFEKVKTVPINGSGKILKKYFFQPKENDCPSTVARLYEELFFDKKLDGPFFRTLIPKMGNLPLIIMNELSQCQNVAEADKKLPDLYAGLWQNIFDAVKANGAFEPEVAQLAKVLDSYEQNGGARKRALQMTYLPMIQKLLKNGNFGEAQDIAGQLEIPIGVSISAPQDLGQIQYVSTGQKRGD